MKKFIEIMGSYYIAYFVVLVSTAIISIVADSKAIDNLIAEYEIVLQIIVFVGAYFIHKINYGDKS